MRVRPMCKPGLRTLVSWTQTFRGYWATLSYLIIEQPTEAAYRHSGAIFADASVQNHIKVVVAGVQGAPDDAQDGEDVQLQSQYR